MPERRLFSFVDGLEYPMLSACELLTGLLAASGLILHEFAEGVIVFAVLRTLGMGSAGAAVFDVALPVTISF